MCITIFLQNGFTKNTNKTGEVSVSYFLSVTPDWSFRRWVRLTHTWWTAHGNMETPTATTLCWTTLPTIPLSASLGRMDVSQCRGCLCISTVLLGYSILDHNTDVKVMPSYWCQSCLGTSWSGDTPCTVSWRRRTRPLTSFSHHWGLNIHLIIDLCGLSWINENKRENQI